MTELAVYEPQNTLTEQMEYARAVSVAHMLPDNYRGKPADIMLAVGLGQSMGLSPAESLYRISVIKGKPTASAELIAANVRKAGHRLRVRGDEQSCTATIIRADDPDYEFAVTRDLAWAQRMGLASNDNYKRQPGTMLQWRAITAVARLACPEALYGVIYAPDEIEGIDDRRPAVQQPASAAARMGAILGTTPTDGAHTRIPDEPEVVAPEPVTAAQLKKIGAAMRDLGITERANALLYVNDVIGREVSSRNELTKDEASRVIDSLERDQTPADPDADYLAAVSEDPS